MFHQLSLKFRALVVCALLILALQSCCSCAAGEFHQGRKDR